MLCGHSGGFNLQAATRVAANDKEGRERLCRYILRPPLANDSLKILGEGKVRLELKRPWSERDIIGFTRGSANNNFVVSIGGKKLQFAMPGSGWATVKLTP